MKVGHLILVAAAVATPALADMPPAKQAELATRGIFNWTPGQNQGQGPAFAVLPNALAAPENPILDTATSQYDDGNLTAVPTVFGQVYGNKWSLGVGGVQLDTITLNSFSFYFLEDSLPDTGLFFQAGPPTGTMSINALVSTNVTGLMNSGPNFSAPVLNVVNASALGAATMFNDTFFLGGWCLNSNTMLPVDNETLGLATNGPRQQGYTANSGTGPQPFAAQAFNAILRANITSPNAVPVELMSFGVDN
jgi:hypothetical protein